MQTKLYPTKGKGMDWLTPEQWTHSASDVRAGFEASMKALQTDRVEMFYLHGPDRNTPFEETLNEINKLHQEGRFDRFGLSNFQSWEVARICDIAEKNGWVKPSVYQGLYNAFQRSVEAELIPCLRHYGIALYAFREYHLFLPVFSKFNPSPPPPDLTKSFLFVHRTLSRRILNIQIPSRPKVLRAQFQIRSQ
jgi:aflatoxin B1 aldehyde reductase